MKELLVIGEQSFSADFLVQKFAKSGFKVSREDTVGKNSTSLVSAAERILILWSRKFSNKNKVLNVQDELEKVFFSLCKYHGEKNTRVLVLAPAACDNSLVPEEKAECAALETEIKDAGHAYAASGATFNLLRVEAEILTCTSDIGVKYKNASPQIFEAAKHMLTNATIYINGTAIDY